MKMVPSESVGFAIVRAPYLGYIYARKKTYARKLHQELTEDHLLYRYFLRDLFILD